MKFELNTNLRGIPDEEILEDLRKCARDLGKDSITMEEYNEIGKGHSATIVRKYGSWPKALSIAGLEQSRSQISIPETDLLTNIYEVWKKLGRQPKYSEIKKPLSKFSAGTYENRFGSWAKALAYFVNWVNTDEIIDDNEPNGNVVEPIVTKIKHRTKRDISDRQRFRILVRDGFKCKSCGASPLNGNGIELHVDHIIPWSKGGETIDENLQTKCRQCNLGKGNAFDQ